MSKEKQIDEMVRDIMNTPPLVIQIVGRSQGRHYMTAKHLARHLHAQDYRKQSVGEWISKGTMIRTPSAKNYTCSACDYDSAITTPYCPSCGAKMKGGGE